MSKDMKYNRNNNPSKKKSRSRLGRRLLLLILTIAMVLPQSWQVSAAGGIGANIGTNAGGEIMTFTGAVGSFYANGSIDTDPGVWQGFNMADTIIMAYPQETHITVTVPANFYIERPGSADEDPEDVEYGYYYAFHVRSEESPDVEDFDLSEVYALDGDVVLAKDLEAQYPGFLRNMNSNTDPNGYYTITEESRIIFFDEKTVADLFRDAGSQAERLNIEAPLTIRVGGETLPFNTKQTYRASYLRFRWSDENGMSQVIKGGGYGQMLVTTPKESIGVEVEPEKSMVSPGETVEITIHCSNYSDMGLEDAVLEIFNGVTTKRLSGKIDNLKINGTPIDDSRYDITDDGRIVFDRWFSFLRMLPDNMEGQRETNKNNPPFTVTFDYTVHQDDIADQVAKAIPIRGVLTASTPANSFDSWQKVELYRILIAQSGYRWTSGAVWDYGRYGDPDLSTYYDTSANSNYFYVNDPLEYQVDMEEEDMAKLIVVGDFPEPDSYTVTYYANYTGAPLPDRQEFGPYVEGETVPVQSGSLFSRNGYTFLGWSYRANDSTLAYTADDIAAGGLTFDMPDENVFLYAQWKTDPVDPGPDPAYNVRYHANYAGAAGTPIVDENGPYTAGTTVTLKQGSLFSRSGYIFLGWSETNNGPVIYTAEQVAPATGRPAFTMPAGVKDFYAQWEKEPVDPGNPPALIYMPNEGARADGSTDPYRDETPVYGKSYDILYNDDASVNLGYMREGYTFLGWHETPDPDPDTTTGWYQEGSRIVAVDWEGDKVVYAIWVERDPKIPDYLVLYNANCSPFEGSVIDGNNAYYANSEVTVQGNQYFNPPDYYQFVGWNTEPDGSGEWYDPDDVFTMPAQNVTLYAQWELKPFRVFYDGNATGVTGSVEDEEEYVRGDTVTVKANGFSRSGYTFTGWSETANGPVVYTAAQLASGERPTLIMPGRDVYLYAQWSKDSTGGGGGGNNSRYNVIYHSTYATRTVTDGSYNSGATVTVKGHSVFPSATIDVPSATFLGWSDSLNGSAVTYESGDIFLMPSRDVNLYAVYELEEDMLNRDDHYAYVVGYPDGTVRPDDLITREELTTIFFRLLTDASRDQYWQQVNDFEDVRYGRWSNNAVSTMANAGIVSGYTDGSFRPAGNITRAEVAVIAAQFDSTVYNGASKFGDIGGHWAADYINRAAERGWVNGYPDGSFQPDEYITRAEMMTLINQVLNRNPESAESLLDDMVRWPDNADTGVWYYVNVQEATNSHYYEMAEDGIHEWWTQLRPVRDWAALEQRR